MAIKLFDTLSREIKPLKASDGKNYRFYCCGPTVYGPAHIGNFRTFLIQDVFRRALEIAQMHPFHVRNLTDVDDKTIRRSQEVGQSLEAFTQEWTEYFHKDCSALNMLPPHEEPTATGHISHQIEMIKTLIDKGHAYVAKDGSVYYKVSSFADYGKLAHLNLDTLVTQETSSSGSANLADEYDRESATDFALWKAYKPEDGPNAWDSPWGKGRPGWHIECSAMCREYLGDTCDLHGGGVDLTFPHHENEIAQSEGATGKTFAHHWLHSAHLQVEGEKMSKSLGNLYTLADLEEKGFDPHVVRYVLISAHYRQPLNFTFDGLHAAESAIHKLEKLANFLKEKANQPDYSFEGQTPSLHWGSFGKFWELICDDLNVPGALGALFTAAKELEHKNISPSEALEELKAFSNVLYVLGVKLFAQKKIEVPVEMIALAQQRWDAKKSKDFAKADELRQAVEAKGWKILDSKEGFELEPLR